MPRRVLFLSMAAVCLTTVGCGGSGDGGSATASSTPTSRHLVADGLARLPAETPEDLVTYGDAVVVTRVVSDEDIRPSEAEDDLPEDDQVVGRRLQVEVEETVWQRGGADDPPRSFEYEGLGWVGSGDERIPMVSESGVREEVGDRYLMVIVLYPEGWAPLASSTTRPVKQGQVVWNDEGAQEPTQDETALSTLFDGRSPREIGRSLAATEPDPAADFSLDPEARFQDAMANAGG